MLQRSQQYIALGLCMMLVAVSAVGCSTVEETVRERPKTTVGAAAGVAGGALLGGLIFKSATGAIVGGLLGGLAGGLIGNALENKEQDYETTAREYNYTSAQGTVVRIERAEVEPSVVRRGERVNLITHYALLTPSPNQPTTVTERLEIRRAGELTGNPVHTVQRQGGTWASAIPLTLPQSARPGTYRVTTIVEAGDSQDSATTSFTVQ
jgi:outer membrane lipoprotein SlyB